MFFNSENAIRREKESEGAALDGLDPPPYLNLLVFFFSLFNTLLEIPTKNNLAAAKTHAGGGGGTQNLVTCESLVEFQESSVWVAMVAPRILRQLAAMACPRVAVSRYAALRLGMWLVSQAYRTLRSPLADQNIAR